MIHGPVQEIHVKYSGDLADFDTQPITRHIIKGVLSFHLGSDVNIINSMHLAKVRDVNVVVQKSAATKGFTNLLQVTLKSSTEERLVAGTLLNGYGERIVQIDRFTVDVAPEGTLILISHTDKPGMIGSVGTTLGNNDVNIATMQVGRSEAGGNAIMALSVDRRLPKDVLGQLLQIDGILKAKEITL